MRRKPREGKNERAEVNDKPNQETLNAERSTVRRFLLGARPATAIKKRVEPERKQNDLTNERRVRAFFHTSGAPSDRR